MASTLRVVIERGSKKEFASALDWPGWSRSVVKGKGDPVEAMLAYRDRYLQVIKDLHRRLPGEQATIEVVEELRGSGSTDFGVPEKVADIEQTPLEGKELDRQLDILHACWAYFDEVSARVSPELQKGPRGGGRDRDALIEHVLQPEAGYARSFNLKLPDLSFDDHAGIERQRKAIVEAARELGPQIGVEGKAWTVRYTIRRMAWHVLDHTWEMEDKDLS